MTDRSGHGNVLIPGCSLIQHYPNFNARVRDSLRELVGAEVEEKVEIGLAKDGSGVGGAYTYPFTLLSFVYLIICYQ